MRKLCLPIILFFLSTQAALACSPVSPSLKVVCSDGSQHKTDLYNHLRGRELVTLEHVKQGLPTKCAQEIDLSPADFDHALKQFSATAFNGHTLAIIHSAAEPAAGYRAVNGNEFDCRQYDITAARATYLVRSHPKPICRQSYDLFNRPSLFYHCLPLPYVVSPSLFIVHTLHSPSLLSVGLVGGSFIFVLITVAAFSDGLNQEKERRSTALKKVLLHTTLWYVGLILLFETLLSL